MGINHGFCTKCKGVHTGNHVSYCKECTNEYKREWYSRNRESEVARCAAYNKANPHVPSASMARLRKANPEHYKSYAKDWISKNPDRVKATDQKKRVRALGAPSDGTVTAEEWASIKDKQNGSCFYCGEVKPLEMDHFVPLSKGGQHTSSNIRASCGHCNRSKWTRLPHEFEEYRVRKNDCR